MRVMGNNEIAAVIPYRVRNGGTNFPARSVSHRQVRQIQLKCGARWRSKSRKNARSKAYIRHTDKKRRTSRVVRNAPCRPSSRSRVEQYYRGRMEGKEKRSRRRMANRSLARQRESLPADESSTLRAILASSKKKPPEPALALAFGNPPARSPTCEMRIVSRLRNRIIDASGILCLRTYRAERPTRVLFSPPLRLLLSLAPLPTQRLATSLFAPHSIILAMANSSPLLCLFPVSYTLSLSLSLSRAKRLFLPPRL